MARSWDPAERRAAQIAELWEIEFTATESGPVDADGVPLVDVLEDRIRDARARVAAELEAALRWGALANRRSPSPRLRPLLARARADLVALREAAHPTALNARDLRDAVYFFRWVSDHGTEEQRADSAAIDLARQIYVLAAADAEAATPTSPPGWLYDTGAGPPPDPLTVLPAAPRGPNSLTRDGVPQTLGATARVHVA